MFRLDQKTAVVTGGGSGIGRAISLLFASSGAEVHILDLQEQAALDTLAQIQREGGRGNAHRCNVAHLEEVESVFQKIGKLDILVNNAGIAHVGNLENTAPEDLEKVMAVNVWGVYHCLHTAVPLMRQRGGGVILNLSSIAAQVGIPDRFAYSLTKGAVMAMTLSVAKDYLHDHIRCNCISPARIHTPFVDGFIAKNYPGREAEIFEKLSKTQPIGRMGKPEEVAALALFLCSDEAGFITGCDYAFDGGFIKLNN
ncbi:MAG: glucose 1-dehydrogenase [Haliscomenobacter sp.]|nr:glucose 1-dehydrogenase [Haliscomenobacter sp.]MBK7477107.1 glucose 1-dehydrogenase [Haliscomenobacter sp.]MBK8878598.1 glucose 1-dehydrogenase [Haliscomenobacter sp.]